MTPERRAELKMSYDVTCVALTDATKRVQLRGEILLSGEALPADVVEYNNEKRRMKRLVAKKATLAGLISMIERNA